MELLVVAAAFAGGLEIRKVMLLAGVVLAPLAVAGGLGVVYWKQRPVTESRAAMFCEGSHRSFAPGHLSGMLLLRHLGESEAAEKLEQAVAAVIAQGQDVTYDMKPHRDDPTAVGTQEMADAICRRIEDA